MLDVGCGTGENARYFAEHGLPTLGIDFAPSAIRRAESKFAGAGLPLRFRVADALRLSALGERFDTITDCGLFHQLHDPHRPVYSASVRSVLAPGGRFFLLCFRDDEPKDWGGPRRISREEIGDAFHDGWIVRSIERAGFDTTLPDPRKRAWMVTLEAGGPG